MGTVPLCVQTLTGRTAAWRGQGRGKRRKGHFGCLSGIPAQPGPFPAACHYALFLFVDTAPRTVTSQPMQQFRVILRFPCLFVIWFRWGKHSIAQAWIFSLGGGLLGRLLSATFHFCNFLNIFGHSSKLIPPPLNAQINRTWGMSISGPGCFF